jgi:hypothetical protein
MRLDIGAVVVFVIMSASCASQSDGSKPSAAPSKSESPVGTNGKTIEYSPVQSLTFNVDRDKENADRLEAIISKAVYDNLATLGGTPISKLEILNLSTGAVMYTDPIDNYATAISLAPYTIEEKKALVLQWSSAAYDFVDIYLIDDSKIEKVTDGIDCRGSFFVYPTGFPNPDSFDLFAGDNTKSADSNYFVYRYRLNSDSRRFEVIGKIEQSELEPAMQRIFRQ